MNRATPGNLHGIAGSYQDALRLLTSRKRPSRPAPSSKEEPSSQQYTGAHLRGTASVVGMSKWLEILGHSAADLKALNVIHVAGTKGKGSTCALTEALLRTYGMRTGYPRKTGLYTSPHLVVPEERIRINFNPLSEDQFAKYFFEVYHTLERSEHAEDSLKPPRYLQLWALTAFHAFIREKVDVAIIETHHGGEFDATNFIKEPVVTVVTTLGMDHVEQLGSTLNDIAWHKSGIFKQGAIAVTAPQVPEAAAVLRERASEKEVRLEVAGMDAAPSDALVRLPAEVQRLNCNVALLAANTWLQGLGINEQLSSDDIARGINAFSWPGRFQQLQCGKHWWYLDAAHNELSMDKAAQWFAEATSHDPDSAKTNTLMFSHISSGRNVGNMLRSLLTTLKAHHVSFEDTILTTYEWSEHTDHSNTGQRADADLPPAKDDMISSSWETYSEILAEYYPDATVHRRSTIDAAVKLAQELGNSRILATGSQHLLGGILHSLPVNQK